MSSDLVTSDPRRLSEAQLKALLAMASWNYPKDEHFERFALASILTDDDAERFLSELQSERGDAWGTCSKVMSARSFMKYDHGDFIHHMDWVRLSIAQARRTCCWCHDTGSFQKRAR